MLKSADEWAREIVDNFCDITTGRGYCYKHRECPDEVQVISKALESFATERIAELEAKLGSMRKLPETSGMPEANVTGLHAKLTEN